jgi:hypothetical protein
MSVPAFVVVVAAASVILCCAPPTPAESTTAASTCCPTCFQCGPFPVAPQLYYCCSKNQKCSKDPHGFPLCQ